MGALEEFENYDEEDSWHIVYQQICNKASINHDFSLSDSKRPEYKSRNRYRDVSPYDHSRIQLKRDGIDYINANLVQVPKANRKYILAQGPLPNTCGHFWLMVWEQNSAAVLMLNRVVEKGRKKCDQYFPTGSQNEGDDESIFDDVNLKVTFLSETNMNYFIIRKLLLTDLQTNSSKEILQFHYTTWPDFGVPESPQAFLNFLMSVRNHGVLEKNEGPPVIHCSAGIGRSGTFCLVDTCLVFVEKFQDLNAVDIRDILMEMRKCRMGLIQTHDQLRFSYLAIIEGAKLVLSGETNQFDEFIVPFNSIKTTVYINDLIDIPPPLPPKPKSINHTSLGMKDGNKNIIQGDMPSDNSPIDDSVLRQVNQNVKRRDRADRKLKTQEMIEEMKRKQDNSEKWKIRRNRYRPLFIGAFTIAVVIGSGIYMYFSTANAHPTSIETNVNIGMSEIL